MKFTEHLGGHLTPEWRKQYINYEFIVNDPSFLINRFLFNVANNTHKSQPYYFRAFIKPVLYKPKEMKQMLYAAVEAAPSPELVEPEVHTRYFAKFDEKFFHYCDKELTKINTFFSEKLAEATRKFGSLKSELSEALENEWVKKEGSKFPKAATTALLKKRNAPARKIAELKNAYSEYYLSLVLLQNYQELNSTGFRKILKKHDKLLSTKNGAKYYSENVTTTPFHTNKDISRLIQETEETVTDLEAGDRQRAMKRLRVPPMAEKQSPWITFKVGLFSGSFIILLLAVILSAIAFLPSKGDWKVPVRLFRSQILVVLFTFLMGINVYGWRSSGVNHVLIFELDPRHHLSEQHIMEMAAIFGVLWSLAVLAFIYSDVLGIPAFANPLALTVIMLLFLFNPTKTLRHEARWWSLRVMGRIIAAPFFYVGFADFWLADQLTSLVPALVDMVFFTCYYVTIADWNIAIDSSDICINKYHYLRLLVACLPSWFRFAQCLRRYRDTKEKFPHLANAAKYATSFFVLTFSHVFLITSNRGSFESLTSNPWFYMWLFASIISTGYSYTWDIKMDWGLFDKKAGDNKFLREEVVYAESWYYYSAILEDLIFRLGWVMSISLVEMGYIHAELMVSILSTCEVFRRFIWNFFRLENEHLNNCGKFRAVRDISVAPMDSSDQGLIVKMMDATDDIVRNRGKHKGTKKGKKDEVRVLVEHEESTDMDI